MIDLHMHSKYSDGSDDWVELLQKAEAAGLTHISITDHKNCDIYSNIVWADVPKYYSGKIILGIEPECFFHGRVMELLGYGFDLEKMNELLNGLYLPDEQVFTRQMKMFHANLVRGGVKFSPDVLQTWDRSVHYYPSCHLLADLKKYPQNKNIISDQESWDNSIQFFRNWSSDMKSPFYVDESEFYPSLETMLNIIKQAGGKVFLPHVFIYGEASLPMLNEIVEKYDIDGIECYYPSYTEEQTKFLLDFCKRHDLLISAGSDYHGCNRCNQIGTGVSAEDIGLDGWGIK